MIPRLLRLVNWPRAVQGLITLILLCLSVYALAGGFHAARWVWNDTPVLAGAWLGLTFGWALARTRWPGWAAGLYTLFLSLAIACQGLGSIFQPRALLNTADFWQALDLLNVRTTAFLYRASGWFEPAFSGQRVEDTGFFIFLMAVLGCITTTWLVWWVIRRRAALPGVLLGGLLLALNTHLSRQNSVFLLLFLFSAVLLLARTSLTDSFRSWDERAVDYPYDLGLNWGASAAGLAVIIGLSAWLAGVILTPQAWRKAADWLTNLRQQTSQTAEQLFPNVNPPVVDDGLPRAQTPNLSEIGAPLPRGGTIVMRVSLSDPPPPPPEAPSTGAGPPIHYWRSEIFAAYTGRGWEAAPEGLQTAGGTGQPPPGRYALQQRFAILAEHGGALYAASQPQAASGGVRLIQAGDSHSTLLQGEVEEYQVTSFAPRVTAGQLRDAGTDYPAEIARMYLQLPDGLPQRVRSLAGRLAGSAQTPYDQALRIQEYLRNNFEYDLTVALAPPDADVVDDFLFRSQAGFCSHFASTMAVMLRTQGIPARVAGGYAMGVYDDAVGAYLVPADAAHAWVEVYFPGYGWIEFEPTASVGTITYPEQALAPVLTPDPLAQEHSGRTLNGWLAAGLAAAGALVAFLLRWAGAGGSTSAGLTEQPAAFYRQVRRSLGRLGLSAPPSATPLEFLRRHQSVLHGLPGLTEALRCATDLHQQALYSPRPPTRAQVQAVRRSWRGSWRERAQLARLRLRWLFTPPERRESDSP